MYLAVLASATRIIAKDKLQPNKIQTIIIQLSKINFTKNTNSQNHSTQITNNKTTPFPKHKTPTKHPNLKIKHPQKISYIVIYGKFFRIFIYFDKFSKKESPRSKQKTVSHI